MIRFKESLWLSFGCGTNEVATNYAAPENINHGKIGPRLVLCDIMIDEEYNIKLINYVINHSKDVMEIEKGYIFEFGILLLEWIMKRVRHGTLVII
ncbi:hypothetical protein P3L10_010802 [Capsicum annuum]